MAIAAGSAHFAGLPQFATDGSTAYVTSYLRCLVETGEIADGRDTVLREALLRRRTHAPVAAADDHRDIAEFRAVALLDGGIEGVAVEMGDGEIVKLGMPQDAHRSADRTGIGTRGRTAAAVAAEGLHGANIGSAGRNAKAGGRLPGARAASGCPPQKCDLAAVFQRQRKEAGPAQAG